MSSLFREAIEQIANVTISLGLITGLPSFLSPGAVYEWNVSPETNQAVSWEIADEPHAGEAPACEWCVSGNPTPPHAAFSEMDYESAYRLSKIDGRGILLAVGQSVAETERLRAKALAEGKHFAVESEAKQFDAGVYEFVAPNDGVEVPLFMPAIVRGR